MHKAEKPKWIYRRSLKWVQALFLRRERQNCKKAKAWLEFGAGEKTLPKMSIGVNYQVSVYFVFVFPYHYSNVNVIACLISLHFRY